MKKNLFILIVLGLLFAGVAAFAELKDGSFTAKDAADKQGYAGTIKITVSGGKIVKVEYDEFKGNDSKKASNYVNTEMKKRTGVAFAEAAKKLEAELVTDQNPGKVDKITGATGLSKRFVDLAKQALGSK